MARFNFFRSLLLTAVCFSWIGFSGCFLFKQIPVEKTPKEKALDEIWYISTPEQRKELKNLNTPEEISRFLEDFWAELDPTPETPENELKIEYYRRYEYAAKYYPDSRGWGKSDRARVYILYGPPDEIVRVPWVMNSHVMISPVTVESLEIWVYMRQAGRSEDISIFDNHFPNQMKFIFADTGFGRYAQVSSTELGEMIDPRAYIPWPGF